MPRDDDYGSYSKLSSVQLRDRLQRMTAEDRMNAAGVLSYAQSGRAGREDVFAPGSIANAKAILEESKRNPSRATMAIRRKVWAQKRAKDKAVRLRHKKAITKAMKNNWQINGLAVKPFHGKLIYDIDKIGKQMGLTKKQIQTVKTTAVPSTRMSTGDRLEDLFTSKGSTSYVGGKKGAKQSRNIKALRKLGKTTTGVLHNIMQIDPTLYAVDPKNKHHMFNLTKIGHFSNRGGESAKKLLNDKNKASGIGKYASKIVPALASLPFGALAATAPMTVGGLAAGAGISAAPSAMQALQKGGGLTDIAKAAAIGAGGFGIGQAAKVATSGIQSALPGAAGKYAAKGASAVIKSAGQEGLKTALTDESFDLGNVAKGAAINMAADIAAEKAMEHLKGTKFGEALGISDKMTPTKDVVPSATEVDASPGDTLPGTKQDAARLEKTDMGYGATHSQIAPGVVPPTIEELGGPYTSMAAAQEQKATLPPINPETGRFQYSPGIIEAPIMKDLPPLSLTQAQLTPGRTGVSAIESVMTGGVMPDQAPIEELGGPYRSRQHDPYYSKPDKAPFEKVTAPRQYDPYETLARVSTGLGTVDAAGEFTNIPGIQDPLVSSGIMSADPMLSDYESPKGDMTETMPLGEFAENVVKPGLGIIASGLYDAATGGFPDKQQPTGRQAQLVGMGSTAGAEDPYAEQQVLKTGVTNINPNLYANVQEGEEFLTDEEKRKRKELWMGNPIIE